MARPFKIILIFTLIISVVFSIEIGNRRFAHPDEGRYVEIELKRRYINVDTYKTIIIEPYKMQYANENKDTIQLYVNFTNDNHAIVFNLHRIGNATKTEYDIPSKLYDRIKTSNRYNLPMSNAWIYKKDENNKYKLIQKGL